jgi:hypothetical protein
MEVNFCLTTRPLSDRERAPGTGFGASLDVVALKEAHVLAGNTALSFQSIASQYNT